MRIEIGGYGAYIAIFMCLLGTIVFVNYFLRCISMLIGMAYDKIETYFQDRHYRKLLKESKNATQESKVQESGDVAER